MSETQVPCCSRSRGRSRSLHKTLSDEVYGLPPSRIFSNSAVHLQTPTLLQLHHFNTLQSTRFNITRKRHILQNVLHAQRRPKTATPRTRPTRRPRKMGYPREAQSTFTPFPYDHSTGNRVTNNRFRTTPSAPKTTTPNKPNSSVSRNSPPTATQMNSPSG
jgi:hypothetical protein